MWRCKGTLDGDDDDDDTQITWMVKSMEAINKKNSLSLLRMKKVLMFADRICCSMNSGKYDTIKVKVIGGIVFPP